MTIPCPRLHQLPALLEQITTQIGLLGIVADARARAPVPTTSRAKSVCSAAQSRNVALKPCRGRRAAGQFLRQAATSPITVTGLPRRVAIRKDR